MMNKTLLKSAEAIIASVTADDVEKVALARSIAYVMHEGHGELYAFAISNPFRGAHSAHRLEIWTVTREELLERLVNGRALVKGGFFHVQGATVKVRAVTPAAFAATFGNVKNTCPKYPVDGYKTYADLPLDPSNCAGKRARTFEKTACKALGYKWVGGLSNVQVDGVSLSSKERLEVKGLHGRIEAFMPSQVDKD